MSDAATPDNPHDVVVTSFKPAAGGKGDAVRLYNTSDRACLVTVEWHKAKPQKVFLSNISETPTGEVPPKRRIPLYGILTLYVERASNGR